MDTGTIIIGLLCFALCLAPFLLLGRKRRQNEKEVRSNFYAFAGENGTNISKEEVLKSCMIGLDENKKTLFFIRKNAGKWLQQSMSLENVRKCELVKFSAASNIASVELVLQLKNQEKVSLVFYLEDEDGELGMELVIATRWQELISDQL